MTQESARTESRNPSREPAPVKLFLRLPEFAEPAQGVGRLARVFGLETFGPRLLSKRARIEMNWMARMLLFVLLFEILVWSLAWNGLINSSVFAPNFKTFLAVLAGSGFAFLTLVFERQMITYDESRRGWRFWRAWIARVLYVSAGALITSQPFELLFFKAPLANRQFEEAVREDVVRRYVAYKSTLEKAQSTSISQPSDSGSTAGEIARIEWTELLVREQDAKKELDAATKRQAEAEGQVALAKTAVDQSNRQLRTLGTTPDDEVERRNAETRRTNAERRIAQAVALVGAALREGKEAGARLQEARQAEIDAKKPIREEATRLHKILGSWIADLQKLRPKDEVPLNELGWKLGNQPSQVFEDLRRLDDLVAGRPPEWRGATQEVRVALANEYQWEEPTDCEGADKDPEELNFCQALGRRAVVYKKAYWLSFAFALFVPLALLFIKALLFPEALAIYYSRVNQAAAGEADSVLATRVLERAKPIEGGRL